MTESSGFTVKEILTELVLPELKGIRQAIALKADRSDLDQLAGRVKHVEEVQSKVPLLIKEQVDKGIAESERERQEQDDRQFSRRDAVLLAVLGAIGAVATITSAVVMVMTAGGRL